MSEDKSEDLVAWVDDEGDVHVVAAPDPETVLPDGLHAVMESYVLVADFDEALDRIGLAMEFLEDRQEDLLEALRQGRNVSSPGTGETVSSQREQSQLPERFVSILTDAIERRSTADALQMVQSAVDVVADWQGLCLSHERLFGHLVLRHRCTCDPECSNEELLILHSRLHAPDAS